MHNRTSSRIEQHQQQKNKIKNNVNCEFRICLARNRVRFPKYETAENPENIFFISDYYARAVVRPFSTSSVRTRVSYDFYIFYFFIWIRLEKIIDNPRSHNDNITYGGRPVASKRTTPIGPRWHIEFWKRLRDASGILNTTITNVNRVGNFFFFFVYHRRYIRV